MQPGQILHVLADKKGTIIGAGFLESERTQATEVQARIVPLKDQVVLEVSMTEEMGKLEGPEDFRRLSTEFYLPRGKKELARKRSRASRVRRRKTS